MTEQIPAASGTPEERPSVEHGSAERTAPQQEPAVAPPQGGYGSPPAVAAAPRRRAFPLWAGIVSGVVAGVLLLGAGFAGGVITGALIPHGPRPGLSSVQSGPGVRQPGQDEGGAPGQGAPFQHWDPRGPSQPDQQDAP